MAKVTVRNRNKNKFDKNGNEKPANWEYRFEIAKVNGKRRHASKSGFKSKSDAEKAGTQALAEYLQAGQIFKPSEISVSDFLDQWFEQYVKMNLKPATIRGYSNYINNHIKPKIGHYHLKALSPATLQDFINTYKNSGYGIKTTKSVHGTLKTALSYAVQPLQYIKSNPMLYVQLPKIDKDTKQRIIITPENWQTIIDRFPFGDRFHIPLMIGYHTGLRISEVFGLTWDNIDFKRSEIRVEKQQLRYKFTGGLPGVWAVGEPKTKSSIRTVKIGSTLLETLKREKLRQSQNRLKYGEYYTLYDTKKITDKLIHCVPGYTAKNPINFVCVEDSGKWLNTFTFRWCSHRIHNELKLNFDFHSLRHTHATMLAENGVNPKNLQKRLGHNNIQTTLETYIHDTEKLSDETVMIFEQIINKNVSTR